MNRGKRHRTAIQRVTRNPANEPLRREPGRKLRSPRTAVPHNRHDRSPISGLAGKPPKFVERRPSVSRGENSRRTMRSTAPKFNSVKVDTPDMILSRRAI
jgi:hypothetical protein